MTAIFHDMMHQEMEDYVDHIVVKSKTRTGYFQVLERVFERYKMYKHEPPEVCLWGIRWKVP